ncbi:peptidase S58 DmpA [Deinococcus proteolyticus MRP]|uniref:Peptidase S58 DmpA n=1 Tax=Deinococcus proteolyticus (strain ATCC 35074 / DSM 20540 / JCM 6276 / NBRC 101906 / NCIMB 13154 / VKM Ac-1939 / CCM 2703 / MRP) TaxID=693977 RepID=F0RNT9_DEIPM|nr:P1 family peptidase [Deinococcus proteolyticus]ADY25322.1 peptidase S58 DmpA [Deinococcus proteolyticus MRP]
MTLTANATLTALPSFQVGHWTDPVGLTGCTVVLCPPEGAVASASFLGPSPGTREGVLLAPEKAVERVHALLLTGGSAFGLAAADGLMRGLETQGRGVETGFARVPIVPAAVIYDLGSGDPQARPTAESGLAALQAASSAPVSCGAVGAGTGATVSKWRGPAATRPGGLGSVFLEEAGVGVGVLAVVNPVGDVLDERGQPLGQPPGPLPQPQAPATAVQNTTLLAVATEHALTKAECRRLADAACAALARVISPSHTGWDGDAAFVLSSGTRPAADPLRLTDLTARAVCAAVRQAVRLAAEAGPQGRTSTVP